MLTYHQGFDIYHTAFRIVKVLNEAKLKTLEKEKLRIVDFIILFPTDLENIRMPLGSTKYRSKFKINKYNLIPNRKRLFFRFGKYFETSLQCLLTFGILDLECYKNNIIKLIESDVSKKIIANSFNQSSIDPDIITFVTEFIFEMPLHELKLRTDLIEYRYDVS